MAPIPCPSPERVQHLAAQPENWKSPADAADLAGIHVKTLLAWLRSGLFVVDHPGPPRARLLVVLVDERGYPVKRPAATRAARAPRRASRR